MKKYISILLLASFSACSDGDLQIETIDFSESAVQYCGSSVSTGTTIFFKINADEALILKLQNGLLKNTPSGGTISSALPGQSQITYRIFSDAVTKGYFCDAIPPSTPVVEEEITAQAGEVLLTTIQSTADTTVYEHTIELSGISLVNEQGERITNLNINDFGTITTKKN
jgi:hypothetical protein